MGCDEKSYKGKSISLRLIRLLSVNNVKELCTLGKYIFKALSLRTDSNIWTFKILPVSARHSPYILYYYTSEEFFLYKITVDKWTIHHFTRQNELLTGT